MWETTVGIFVVQNSLFVFLRAVYLLSCGGEAQRGNFALNRTITFEDNHLCWLIQTPEASFQHENAFLAQTDCRFQPHHLHWDGTTRRSAPVRTGGTITALTTMWMYVHMGIWEHMSLYFRNKPHLNWLYNMHVFTFRSELRWGWNKPMWQRGGLYEKRESELFICLTVSRLPPFCLKIYSTEPQIKRFRCCQWNPCNLWTNSTHQVMNSTGCHQSMGCCGS